MVAGRSECRMTNAECRIAINGSIRSHFALRTSHFALRTSHFATVAKRAFVAERLARVNVAFDDEVGVGGDFEIVGLALDEFDGFLAEITGEEKFVEAVGQRRGCGEREHGIAAEKNGDGHARAGFVVAAAVARADFLELPVHAGGAVIVNLDAIHADVALAGVGVFGDDAREGDEAAAVQGPALLNRKIQQRG